jgi:hypothetical protein
VLKVKELTKRIENLEAGNRIGFTGINAGALNVNGGIFRVGTAAYFGPVTLGSDTSNGWILRRADGRIVFQLAGVSNDDQFWGFQDNEGNLIVTDDGASNRGLGRPYLPIFVTEHSNTVPVLTTTSGTFVSTETGRFVRQHPRVQFDVLCRSSDGTTPGEVQLWDPTKSAIIAGPTAISAGSYSLIQLGPAMISSDYGQMAAVELEVQIRRTGGAGTIGARTFRAFGLQS